MLETEDRPQYAGEVRRRLCTGRLYLGWDNPDLVGLFVPGTFVIEDLWGSLKISRRNPCFPYFSVSYSINRHKIL